MSTPEDTFRRLRQVPLEQIMAVVDRMTDDEFNELIRDASLESQFFDSYGWTYEEYAKAYRDYITLM